MKNKVAIVTGGSSGIGAATALAFAKQYFEFDWPGVEQGYKRAIELNPGYAPAHQWYGEYYFLRKAR